LNNIHQLKIPLSQILERAPINLVVQELSLAYSDKLANNVQIHSMS
jgi:hypothetical protein